MYELVVGIMAIGILLCCCFLCTRCLDDDEANITSQPNSRAQLFRRTISNTSQRANAYLPPSYEEVVTNTKRNFQVRLQRRSSLDNRHSTNPPTTEISQPRLRTEVHIHNPASTPPPPHHELQELPPRGDRPPPSYQDAMKP